MRKAGKSQFSQPGMLLKTKDCIQNSNSKARGENGCWINSQQAESWFSGGYWRSNYTKTLWVLLCNNVRCHGQQKWLIKSCANVSRWDLAAKILIVISFLQRCPRWERGIGSTTQKDHQWMDVSDITVEVWVHGPEWKSQWFLVRSFQYFKVLNLSFIIALPSLKLITSWLRLDQRMTGVF